MINKPDFFLLTGKSGRLVIDKIHSARPSSAFQYTKKEKKAFENQFSKYIPDIIDNWNKNSK